MRISGGIFMTDFQTGVIALLRCAVTGAGTKLPDGFSIEEAERFAVKQNITTLVYEGAVLCGISTREPAMQRMFQRYIQLMMHSERQIREFERVFHAFDENGIDYLPLKGCTMKKHYPKPELRYMGDADILIRSEQYDRIQTVMEKLGFERGLENDYEYHWRNPGLNVELHKSLVSSANGLFYDYWKDVWNRAQNPAGTRFLLSSEDDLLFQLTHFAKHYRKSGIGVRYLLDLWVFLKTHPNLDEAYLERELSRLNLSEFNHNIQNLIYAWFEDGETTEKTDFMTDYLFSGNSWGSWKNTQIYNVSIKKKSNAHGKFSFLISKLFPPLTTMIFQYPVLKKIPVLLPVFWIIRLGNYWIRNPQNRKKATYIMTKVSDEMVNMRKDHMQYVGLSFEDEQKV